MKNAESLLSNVDMNALVSRVTYLRNDILHMTQAEFSSALQISQTYLSLLESGKKSITEAVITNILITFHVNADWLVFGIGSDQDIFLNHIDTQDYLLKTSQGAALHDLKKAYQLKNNELDFISWFVSLSSKERSLFLSCIENISSLIQAHPPGAS